MPPVVFNAVFRSVWRSSASLCFFSQTIAHVNKIPICFALRGVRSGNLALQYLQFHMHFATFLPENVSRCPRKGAMADWSAKFTRPLCTRQHQNKKRIHAHHQFPGAPGGGLWQMPQEGGYDRCPRQIRKAIMHKAASKQKENSCASPMPTCPRRGAMADAQGGGLCSVVQAAVFPYSYQNKRASHFY